MQIPVVRDRAYKRTGFVKQHIANVFRGNNAPLLLVGLRDCFIRFKTISFAVWNANWDEMKVISLEIKK